MNERLNEKANGVYIIAATPFNPDGSLDFRSVDSLIEFYIDKGVTGMTILGMMGEASKMSTEEAESFMAHVMKLQMNVFQL